MFYRKSWIGVSIDEFIKELDRYIRWYNEKRIKQSLGYLSPLEYRNKMAQCEKIATLDKSSQKCLVGMAYDDKDSKV